MSRFTDPYFRYTGRTINGRCEIELMDDLVYEIGYLGSGWTVTAPKGTKSDGVSIPVIVLRFMPAGKMVRAAQIHDALRSDRKKPKLLGDYVFWEAMGAEGTPFWARFVASIAVLLNFTR